MPGDGKSVSWHQDSSYWPLSPSKAVTVTFMIPLFAILYGTVFLGEALTGWMVVCGGVILVGIALATGLLRWGKPTPPGSNVNNL